MDRNSTKPILRPLPEPHWYNHFQQWVGSPVNFTPGDSGGPPVHNKSLGASNIFIAMTVRFLHLLCSRDSPYPNELLHAYHGVHLIVLLPCHTQL